MINLPDIKIILLACATLGLAPFFPEPHVWGKLRWVLGGAHGMQWLDWGDLMMHGLPWMALIWYAWRRWVLPVKSQS